MTTSRVQYIDPARGKQNGAVMVISLLILLVLTLLGITGMTTTTMEERMAGNERDRQIAFQAAEAALRAGERFIVQTNFTNLPADPYNPSGGDDFATDCQSGKAAGLCGPASPGDDDVWEDANLDVWTTQNRHRSYSFGGSTEIATQPRYIIEYMGPKVVAPNTAATCAATPSTCPQIYRVTAYGTGATNNSRVMLQSMFQKNP